jgi:glycerol-3-phosphate dehydrogenase
MELILDAEASNPQARALSYVRAVGASGETVALRDEVTGSTIDVQPQIVINASGAWIDFTNAALGTPTKFIGGTKGSHLILDHPELRAAIGDHEFLFENADGRIVLIMPYFDKVMIGSSDIHVDNPDGHCCTASEVDYYCGMVERVFPGIQITPSQIVFTFTGVRPLPTSDRNFAGQISRDHSIRVTEPDGERAFPVLSLVGGKWTSFRAFSEQTTDAVLSRLGKSRKVSTRDLPIGGGRDYPLNPEQQAGWVDGVASATGLPHEQIRVLFERYGTRAAEIAGYIAEGPDRSLNSAPEYTRREIEYLARFEKVTHLDDLGLRRMTLGMQGGLTCPAIEEMAEIAGGLLGWSPEQQKAEIDRTVEVLAMRHGVRPE